jgi:hypothetical protein
MAQDRNDELHPDERAQFAALSRERRPSPKLEARIISALKSKGLIQMAASSALWTWPRFAGAFAAAIILLGLGFGLGKWQSRPSLQSSARPLFILLLYESEGAREHEPDKVAEYGRWARTIAQSQQLLAGEKLQYDGRLLRRVNERLEVSAISPRGEIGKIAGYFLIQADNYEEAAKIAASCPHLKYGGVIELRQIDRT